MSRPYTNLFPYTIGTNSSFRRTRLIEVGGFDEEFEYYFDETDLCLRLIDCGYVIRALDDGFVYHKSMESERRPATGVIRDRFSPMKNRVYFAMKHAQRVKSFYDICRDLVAFADEQWKDYDWCVYKGWLGRDDFRKFAEDLPHAFNVGFARHCSGEHRTHPAQWFAERQLPFVRFPTLKPQGRKLHLCFLDAEYPPGVINDIAHEPARGLAERGHHVHVLTRGEDHHRVDLRDGVWVHRIMPSPHPPPAAPLVPPANWDYSASMLDEMLRIHRHRAVDLVQAPIGALALAPILEGAIPVVVELPTSLRPERFNGAEAAPEDVAELYCVANCAMIMAGSQRDADKAAACFGAALDSTRLRIAAGPAAVEDMFREIAVRRTRLASTALPLETSLT